MPHIPDSTHDTHDLELIASFAAGDAMGADLDVALRLVADCPDCAAVHADLRAIAAALPLLPAPVRTRDFRVTPDQARALRPAGWRRFIAAVAGPRGSFATPLGTGLAALGIVGVLVASGGLPQGGATGGAAPQAVAQSPADAMTSLEAQGPLGSAAGASEVPGGQALTGPADASVAPTVNPKAPTAGAAASDAPAAAASEAPVASTLPEAMNGAAGTPAAGVGGAATAPTAAPASAAPVPEARTSPAAPEEARRGSDEPLLIAAGAALLAGLALLALRWTSRRLT